MRSYRHLVGLPPGTPLSCLSSRALPAALARATLAAMDASCAGLASLERCTWTASRRPEPCATWRAASHLAIVLPAGALGEAERQRLAGELRPASRRSSGGCGRASPTRRSSRGAPQDVVDGARSRGHELEHKAAMLAETLQERLSAPPNLGCRRPSTWSGSTRVDSTNDWADRMMAPFVEDDDDDRCPDTVLVARQPERRATAGASNAWVSPPGGLYATWLAWIPVETSRGCRWRSGWRAPRPSRRCFRRV